MVIIDSIKNIIADIKEKNKQRRIQKRRQRVSDVRLKDIVSQSDKEEVIDFIIKYLSEEIDNETTRSRYNEIQEIMVLKNMPNEYEWTIIKDDEFLSKSYDEMLALSQKPCSSNLVNIYSIDIGFMEHGIFTFWEYFWDDLFLCLYNIDEFKGETHNLIYTEKEKEKYIPTQVMFNSRLDKDILNHDTAKITGLALLQLLYSDELSDKPIIGCDFIKIFARRLHLL